MNAACDYEGGLVCTCTNCTDRGPVSMCSGAPTWHCDAPNANPNCPPGLPNAGTACGTPSLECQYACGNGNGRTCTGGIWVPSDGGPCPISTRRAKRDIAYLDNAGVDALADTVRDTRLATYEYVDPALAGHRRLGFILEEAQSEYAVDPERSQVDLYGYLSLVVAHAQSQDRRVDALEREIVALRRACRP